MNSVKTSKVLLMRKSGTFASVILAVSILASCSIFPTGKQGQLKSQAQIEHEAMEQFEEVFLDALKNRDSDNIIDCFSEQSRQRTDDFDEGCEYIFELYNGNDNPEVIEDNVSSYRVIGSDGFWSAKCYCKIEAGDEVYFLRWTMAIDEDADPVRYELDALRFEKYDDYTALKNDDERFYMANFYNLITGIYHPGRDIWNEVLHGTDLIRYYGHEAPYNGVPYDQITAPSVEEAIEMGFCFSDELSDPLYDDAKRYVFLFLMSGNNNMGSMWVRRYGDEYALYCNARLGETQGILGIGLDRDGKIKGFVFEQGAENMTGIPEGISGFESIAEALED